METNSSKVLHDGPKENSITTSAVLNGHCMANIEEVSLEEANVFDNTKNIKENEQRASSKVPEGGWGWFVVLGALVINIIYDGCSYSFGILYTDLLEDFGENRSKTAWIGSLFFSIPLLCGPLAELVTAKLGAKKATMLGGLVAAAGFVASSFANSTQVLCLTYGLISGIGISIPYFNGVTMVALYFDKRRALATGISECGAGLGTVIFAPFTDFLISHYGWRGALLILGGIVGNIVVCGLLFRPLPDLIDLNANTKRQPINETEIFARDVSFQDKDFLQRKPLLHKSEARFEEVNDTLFSKDLRNHTDCKEGRKRTDTLSNGFWKSSSLSALECYTNSFKLFRDAHVVPRHTRSCLTVNIEIHNEQSSSKDTFFRRLKRSARTKFQNIKDIHSKLFILFALCSFVMYFCYDIPYVFLVDLTINLGVSSADASILLTIIGIVHTCSNLLYGWLGDRPGTNVLTLYGVSIVFCGLTVLLVPFFSEYYVHAVLAGLFGLFTACTETLCSSILVRILGLPLLNTAYGIIMFLEGVGNLTGPPFAGFLFDVTGRYFSTFLFAGVILMAAGALCLSPSFISFFRLKCGKRRILTDLDTEKCFQMTHVTLLQA